MHEGLPIPPTMHPPHNPTHPLVPRLRSVKIEQGKLNDQANTLAELAKVSKVGPGGWLPGPVWAGWVSGEKRGHFSKGQDTAPAEGGPALGFSGQAGDTSKGCKA